MESYFEPYSKLKPGDCFTKQCQEGTQRDPKKSSFLVGTLTY